MSVDRAMIQRMAAWLRYLLLAAVVFPLAVWTRWHGAVEPKGARFHPWPDAVEYGAEAQAVARSGRVFLQIGPHRVRPRYPPGWPLLLAAAIRCGVEGRDLWRVTAFFGGALACLLAFLAARATETLTSRAEIASLTAGLLAGGLWALAPIAVDLGQSLMSDEPAALVSLSGLVATGAAFLRPAGRRVLAFAAAGGLAFGLAAIMRPIAAALMVPPILVLVIGGVRHASFPSPGAGGREGSGEGSGVRVHLLAWGLGAAVFPALAVVLMVRSGWPALEWSGYRFWTPQRFDRLSSTFHLQYALEPDVTFRREIEGRPLSHLELAARVLLGLPGLAVRHDLGRFWPVLGWLALLPLFRAARRRGGGGAALAPWLAGALLLWTAGHVLVFSLYFYPASRFYLVPLALCVALFATACGLALNGPRLRRRVPAGLVAAAAVLLTVQGFAELRREPVPAGLRRERTRAKFTRWLKLGDEGRAGLVMPFDPVHAQALGLLTPEIAKQVREWGELPNTVHVRRLKVNGYLPREGPAAALESPRRPP